MVKEFKLPDVGEGLTEADIVAWHVKPGDAVEDGQIIVDKATRFLYERGQWTDTKAFIKMA